MRCWVGNVCRRFRCGRVVASAVEQLAVGHVEETDADVPELQVAGTAGRKGYRQKRGSRQAAAPILSAATTVLPALAEIQCPA
jgi:hypothetical protein